MSHGPGTEHGCPKCVINGRMIAPLAWHLAAQNQQNEVRSEAQLLAENAELADQIYTDAIDLGVIKLDPSAWNGCRESKTLTKWIIDAFESQQAMVATMRTWRFHLMSELMTFLSGRPPHEHEGD